MLIYHCILNSAHHYRTFLEEARSHIAVCHRDPCLCTHRPLEGEGRTCGVVVVVQGVHREGNMAVRKACSYHRACGHVCVCVCVCVCDNEMLKLNTIHTKCYHVSDMSWVQLKDPRMCFVMVMLLWHEMTITILIRGRRWGYLSCSLLTPHHLSGGGRWGYLSCSLLTPHHLSGGRRWGYLTCSLLTLHHLSRGRCGSGR